MKSETLISLLLVVALAFIAGALTARKADAQDEVKYCKDARTGQVIVVEASMPCPFPYREL